MIKYPTQNMLFNIHVREWDYHILPLDTAAEAFGAFSGIVDMCRDKLKSGPMASWGDMDFYDFKGWHGSINLMERLNNPFDMKVKLFGVDFSRQFETDLTGLLMSEQEGVSDTAFEEDMEFFEAVVTHPGIGIAYGPASWIKKEFKHLTLIYIPLANDYHHASHILSAIIQSTPVAPLDKY